MPDAVMTPSVPRLVVVGLQQTFLQMVLDQIEALLGNRVEARALSLNELEAAPPRPEESILYFAKGLKAMVEKVVPPECAFIYAKRENLIFNMRELFRLKGPHRILVINDVKINTDEMTRDLQSLNLPHEFIPYYPETALPAGIDYVVTAGERMLIPPALGNCPIIDIGLRFISLGSIYELFTHFKIPFDHADLARNYMRSMMMVSEKWPVLGQDRFWKSSRLGSCKSTRAVFTLERLVSRSQIMKSLARDLRQMASSARPVHIFGKTGTGKSSISQALHNASPCSQGPFITINCAARPQESLDKELFGWEDNGTIYRGLFEAAQWGTLCIEEVGELSTSLQARLLQALSEGHIIRSGGQVHVPVNVRVITTATKELEELKTEGFNPKLLLAITAHMCRVPALAERMDDFEALIKIYLAQNLNRTDMILPPDTLAILKAHTWEGNVQELFNAIQHMVCMARDQVLDKCYLPCYINVPKTIPSGLLIPGDQTSSEEAHFKGLVDKITRHGFLSESQAILSIYQAAKEQHKALGRGAVLEQLQQNGYALSVQQLRLKLELMDSLGLLIVRPGRGGTTLSEQGEAFLYFLSGT